MSGAETYAYYTVRSPHPLADLTAHFGRSPDRGWSVGDARLAPNGRGNPAHSTYEFSCWTLESGLPKGAPLDDHVCALWQRLEPLKERLCPLPDGAQDMIACTGCWPDWDSCLPLSAGHFRMAARLGVTIDFDFYFDHDGGTRVGGDGWRRFLLEGD